MKTHVLKHCAHCGCEVTWRIQMTLDGMRDLVTDRVCPARDGGAHCVPRTIVHYTPSRRFA